MRLFKPIIVATIAMSALSLSACNNGGKKAPEANFPEGVLVAEDFQAESFGPLIKQADTLLINFNNREALPEAVETWNELQIRHFDGSGYDKKNGKFSLYYIDSNPGGFCLSDMENKISLGVDYANVTPTSADFRIYPYQNTHCAFKETDRNDRPYIFLTQNSLFPSDEANSSPDAEIYKTLVEMLKKSELVPGLRTANVSNPAA